MNKELQILCRKTFSTEHGSKLLTWMFNEWVVKPSQERAFADTKDLNHGDIAYNLGKADAFYILKGLSDIKIKEGE